MRSLAQITAGQAPDQTATSPQSSVTVTETVVEPINHLSATHTQVRAALLEHGFIQFYPLVAAMAGSPKAALMLGHGLYWTRTYLSKKPERDGWFYKTATEWRQATGLSTREQETARADLRESGFWSEQLAGAPARMYFRINLAELGRQAALRAQADFNGWNWKDELVSLLMGRPVMYFRPLADLSGSVLSGLLLSHLLGQQRQALMEGKVSGSGWFPINVQADGELLSLGPKAHRNARDSLRNAGFIQEAWTQERRPTLMASVNLQAIVACMAGQAAPSENTPAGRKARKAARTSTSQPALPGSQALLLPSPPSVPNKAMVLAQHGNVTHLARLLGVDSKALSRGADQASSEPATSSISPFQGLPFCRNSNGANEQYGEGDLTTNQQLTSGKGCPFVETGGEGPSDAKGGPFVEAQVALLSKLYIQKVFTNPPPMRERVLTRGGDVVDAAWRGRSLDLPLEKPKAEQASLDAKPVTVPPLAEAQSLLEPVALVMPPRLDPALHDSAMSVMAGLDVQIQQLLLDELAGHMASPHKPVRSPLGFLHTITSKQRDGTLIATMAQEVALARSRQAQVVKAVELAAQGSDQAGDAVTLPSVNPEQIARLRQQRDELIARSRGLS
jgi:hypothetical protein